MRKVYVAVSADFSAEGKILPRFLIWEDGKQYEIDRVKDIQRAASLKVGGVGLRYRIQIQGKESYIWLEDGNKWFVEAKR